jgi:hypothetical protein
MIKKLLIAVVIYLLLGIIIILSIPIKISEPCPPCPPNLLCGVCPGSTLEHQTLSSLRNGPFWIYVLIWPNYLFQFLLPSNS